MRLGLYTPCHHWSKFLIALSNFWCPSSLDLSQFHSTTLHFTTLPGSPSFPLPTCIHHHDFPFYFILCIRTTCSAHLILIDFYKLGYLQLFINCIDLMLKCQCYLPFSYMAPRICSTEFCFKHAKVIVSILRRFQGLS